MNLDDAIEAVAEMWRRYEAQELARRASARKDDKLGPTLEAFYHGRSAGVEDALAVLLGTDQEGALRWLGVDLDRT